MAVFRGTTGADSFHGKGGVVDTFKFEVAELQAFDTVSGGSGAVSDRLVLLDGGAVDLGLVGGGLSGLETIALSSMGNALILAESGVAGGSISVIGGAGDDTIDASAFSAAARINAAPGDGADTALGGAGDDLFRFAPGQLTAADTVTGAAGLDTLAFTGAVDLADSGVFAGVSGIDRISLASSAGMTNLIALSDAVVANADSSSLQVFGGTGDDTVIVEGGHQVVFQAGAGYDSFFGGTGDDILKLAAGDFSYGGEQHDRFFGNEGMDRIQLTSDGTYDITLDWDDTVYHGPEDVFPDTVLNGFEVIELTTGGIDLKVSSRDSVQQVAIIGSKGSDHIDVTVDLVNWDDSASFDITLGAGNDVVDTGYATPVAAQPGPRPIPEITVRVEANQLTDADLITHHESPGTFLNITVVDITTAGSIRGIDGLTNVAKLYLNDGGNGLVLDDGDIDGVRQIVGGTGNDRIDGRAVTAAQSIRAEDLGGGDDSARGGAGNDILGGGDGDDTLRGGDGDDRLSGGIGNDVLAGGNGDDVFVFGPGGGQDTADFVDGADLIDIAAYGYHDFAEFLAGGGTITGLNGGTRTIVAFDGGMDQVTLNGVAPGQITAADFLFAA